MEISEITIRNFKGIKEVTMGPVRPINVLIGRNNSGKSSVLACLQLLNRYFWEVGSAKFDQRNVTIPVPDEYFKKDLDENGYLEISVTVKQTKEERLTNFYSIIEACSKQYAKPQFGQEKVAGYLDRDLFGRLTFNFRANCKGKNFALTSIRTEDEDVATSPNQTPGNPLRGLQLMYLFDRKGPFNSVSELVKHKQSFAEIGINISEGHLNAAELLSGISLLNPAFEYIKNTFHSAFIVSPYRHGEIIAAAQRCNTLSNNGTNIVNYMHDLHLNNYGAFQKVAGFVKQISPEVGNRLHPRFVKKEGSELELAYEWPKEGRVVNLANMGGGIEQLLILGCILIQQRTSCVLWEEPESHLHPAAQEILLNKLEEYVGDSKIFLTTHSPVFIRSSDNVAVHVITNTDGKNGTGRTLSADELQEAATVLGSRPGHLAQADIVVYVEGKSGAAAFEEWLKKWLEKDNVLGHLLLSIQSCNADEVGSEDFDIGKLKKVTPNMIMFVDKDNEPGSDEPKQARKTLRKMCEDIGVPCIITEKRQIEDYFTEEAVKKVLPSNLQAGWNYDASKPMGEQIRNGWKKYNAKIAAAMKWEDVVKHKDIMKVFEEIEKFAKSLKPETNGG
jgi:hypothetical protein